MPEEDASGNVSLERGVRRPVVDLPLGTRFRYLGSETVWVLLSHEDCGICAKWQGIDGPVMGQSICSVAEDRDGFILMHVDAVA